MHALVAQLDRAFDYGSKGFGFDGSNPSPSTTFMLLPRSQAVRHHTLTVACASSNLAEAAILFYMFR